MTEKNEIVYPYIPNTAPGNRQRMLEELGVGSIDEFYADVPQELRLNRDMHLPEPLLSEYALQRHVERILARNTTCKESINFKGAGCWQHHVPSICDEVNRRSEFLTAYAGEPYDDHGRFQTLFETASMMGELLDMDMVNVPTYDGFQAAATSIRMAARLTGRKTALVAGTVNPDMLSKIRDYCRPDIQIIVLDYDPRTGWMDIGKLEAAMSDQICAVFFENPSFLGFVEGQGADISRIAHAHGAQCNVYVDPISLGVLTPPAQYGADIVTGDYQSLGIHMSYGGGHAGFIATRDEERYVLEYPSRLFGIAPTRVDGEYGFGDVAYERTSFAIREKGKEWVGTASALWGITAGVYLALMGPQGMREIGEGIMQRSRYAVMTLSQINGLRCPVFASTPFKEFVVDFSASGRTVAEINQALLERGIFGGHDLTETFPALGAAALFCVTEVHTRDDIDALAQALGEILR